MTRYLEEYDPYMDYYKQVCMDEVLGVTHSYTTKDLTETDNDDVFLDPASPIKCHKCQGLRKNNPPAMGATPLGKPPKRPKPLKSSKSFLGGLRKSRSAEALQSLRVNIKSPSAMDTKDKGSSKSRIKFLARFKRMMTKSEDPLKAQASCSSLSPSVGSMDSKHSDSSQHRRLSGVISFRVGGDEEVMDTPLCKDCEAVRRRFTVIEDQYADLTEEERESGMYKYQSIRR